MEARNCWLRSKRNQIPNRSNRKDRKPHRISNPKPVSIFAKTETKCLRRKIRKPQWTPKPKNRSFLAQKPKHRNRNSQNRKTENPNDPSYMEWMIYGGKLIWCDLLTSKIYQVEGTVFVSVLIFVNKTNTYRLKRWQYRPRAKLSIVSRMLRVFKNIQWWHLVFIYIHFYYVGKICTNITPTNLRAKWEDCRKDWNYITIDFHQEMGQEYSKIVQK